MIYFIQCQDCLEDGPIKIGYTDNPDLKQRIKNLQTENPYPLRVLGVIADGTREREEELHKEFKDLNMRGEWFRCSLRLRSFISKNSKGYAWGKVFRSGETSYGAKQAAAWRKANIEEILRLRKKGVTIKRISEMLERDPATICNTIKKYEDGLIV